MNKSWIDAVKAAGTSAAAQGCGPEANPFSDLPGHLAARRAHLWRVGFDEHARPAARTSKSLRERIANILERFDCFHPNDSASMADAIISAISANDEPIATVITALEYPNRNGTYASSVASPHPLKEGIKLYTHPTKDARIAVLEDALNHSLHTQHDPIDDKPCACSQCVFVRLRDAAQGREVKR